MLCVDELKILYVCRSRLLDVQKYYKSAVDKDLNGYTKILQFAVGGRKQYFFEH
jgi:hypothetical protein